MNEELLTIKEVARVLNCGIPYVYKLTDNGLLPYIKLGHKNTSVTLDIYSHVTQKMKNDTVDIFEKLIK